MYSEPSALTPVMNFPVREALAALMALTTTGNGSARTSTLVIQLSVSGPHQHDTPHEDTQCSPPMHGAMCHISPALSLLINHASGARRGAPWYTVGEEVGEPVGPEVGAPVGVPVGAAVGVAVGVAVGDAVGELVGAVGAIVGEWVGSSSRVVYQRHGAVSKNPIAISLTPSSRLVTVTVWLPALTL